MPYLFEASALSLATVGVAAGGAGEDAQDPDPATAGDREWRRTSRRRLPRRPCARSGDRAPRPRADPRALSPDVKRLLHGSSRAQCSAAPSDRRGRGRVRGDSSSTTASARCSMRSPKSSPDARALGPAGAGAGRPPARRADGAQCVAAGGRDHGRGRGERDRGRVPGARGRRRVLWELGTASQLELLDSSDVPEQTRERFAVYPLELGGLVSEAMVTAGWPWSRAPRSTTRGIRAHRRARATRGPSPLSPCPYALRAGPVGAIFAAANRQHWLDHDRRLLLLGVAEQTGVASNGQGSSRPSARRAASQSSWSGTRHTSPPP